MNILKKIQTVVHDGNYALRPHAVSHMVAEGFDEKSIVEAVENGEILEHYIEEDRCLITGTFQIFGRNRDSLHIIEEVKDERK